MRPLSGFASIFVCKEKEGKPKEAANSERGKERHLIYTVVFISISAVALVSLGVMRLCLSVAVGLFRFFILVVLGKRLPSHTGQEQACTKITRLFVRSFVTLPKMAQYAGKWLLTAP